MLFPNRSDAGKALAERLANHLPALARDGDKDVVVVGLPRGGVLVALEVAHHLHCPLEVLVAKKLPYPGQPEYAIGAVTSDGIAVVNPDIPPAGGWKDYIEEQKRLLFKSTAGMEKAYYARAGQQQHSLKGKTVIVVDDGIATGMTAMAALQSIKKRGAAYVILASPVVSAEAYEQLKSRCHYLVALRVPQKFGSVGQHYLNFEQTTTEEVIAALMKNSALLPAAPKHTMPNSPG